MEIERYDRDINEELGEKQNMVMEQNKTRKQVLLMT